jgi:hypothetical protein
VLTALLFVWTPYAWARLWTSGHALWLTVPLFFGYFVLRHFALRRWFLQLPTTWRRIAAVLVYVLVVALYVAVPVCLMHHEATTAIPWWAIVLATLVGAYLSCLWLGWYFFICLQFNAHGNEAGVAARVVSFAEFLRIKITENCAEVWVIGVEGPSAPERSTLHPCPTKSDGREEPPIARLIDHFVVERTD